MRVIFGEKIEVVDDEDLSRLEAYSVLPADELYRKLSSTAGFEAEGDSHVRIRPETLMKLCASNGDEAWKCGFDRMIESAKAHGYVDPRGWVRAHFTSK